MRPVYASVPTVAGRYAIRREKLFVTFLPPKAIVIEPRSVWPSAFGGMAKTHVAQLRANLRELGLRGLAPILAKQVTRPFERSFPVSFCVAASRTLTLLPAFGRAGVVEKLFTSSLGSRPSCG